MAKPALKDVPVPLRVSRLRYFLTYADIFFVPAWVNASILRVKGHDADLLPVCPQGNVIRTWLLCRRYYIFIKVPIFWATICVQMAKPALKDVPVPLWVSRLGYFLAYADIFFVPALILRTVIRIKRYDTSLLPICPQGNVIRTWLLCRKYHIFIKVPIFWATICV